MSRYLLLIIATIPFITLALIGIVTRYKMRKITKRRATWQVLLWALLLLGLAVAEPLYHWLFANNLTETDSLSLFDVVQIFFIVFLLYVVNGLSIRIEQVEKRVNDLHQEVSIRLSKKK